MPGAVRGNMQREQTEEKSLQVIIGAQLSAVTFVQDYIQLHFDALLTALKKWTFALSMPGVASRWHIFEANVNGFTLVLQAHGAKPLDDRAEQTLV